MLIRAALIKDINYIIKLIRNKRDNFNFYSDLEGSILKYILTKNCFFISCKNDISGIIFINNKKKIVSYIPSDKGDLSFFKLIYLLKNQISLSGYKLTICYRNLNILNVQKYFSISILSNFKKMSIDLCKYNPANFNHDQIKIRNLVTKEEALLRVSLQNEIFGHIKGRSELTLREVLDESREVGFIEKLCFVLELDQNPIGYGQVIFMSENYYLVNFGIIPSFRKSGFGIIFVNEILNICKNNGIKELYLKVDCSNPMAISLYKKAGFKDISNMLSIII